MITNGYRYIHFPSHPDSTSRGYILEHRLVMERHIGRRLKHYEIVHHINDSEKPLDKYGEYIKKMYNDGFSSIYISRKIGKSKPSILKWMKNNGIKRREPKKKVVCDEGCKWCNVCKKVLSVDMFYKSKTTYDGYRNRCIECTKYEVNKYYNLKKEVSE